MKNKILNITILLIILFLGIFIVKNESYASLPSTGGGSGGGSTSTSSASSFNPDSWAPSSTTDASGASRLASIGNTIVGAIQVIGSIISVATLAIIGIKYMTGSVEEKAEYKKVLMPYLIGAILLFGISNILAIVVNIVQGLV